MRSWKARARGGAHCEPERPSSRARKPPDGKWRERSKRMTGSRHANATARPRLKGRISYTMGFDPTVLRTLMMRRARRPRLVVLQTGCQAATTAREGRHSAAKGCASNRASYEGLTTRIA